MLRTIRWLPGIACAIALLACADATDPTAPGPAPAADVPLLSTEGSGSEPSPEELAEMPAEFRSASTILDYWTDAGFLPAEGRAYARGFMTYFATNAAQQVRLSLRFENRPIGQSDASAENSDWLPAVRWLFTTAYMGVSGTCGHLADGVSSHRAWHQFLGGGWKFFSWGHTGRTSGDSAEQPSCPEPPPPPPSPPSGGGGGGNDYEEGCELCTQWFYFIDNQIVDEWWECQPIDMSYCDALMT
jgi:hypothetical protein